LVIIGAIRTLGDNGDPLVMVIGDNDETMVSLVKILMHW
jgi:hypothetical protein